MRSQDFQRLWIVQRDGVVELPLGQCDALAVVQNSGFANLDIINADSSPNQSELLQNGRFSDLMDLLTEKYDYVILDTPPVGLVADALALEPTCLHVVRRPLQLHTG